jgi:hypothetical protein
MSDLILPDSYTKIISPSDARKLITLAFFCCNYARMVHLGMKGKMGEVLTAKEERDIKRLMNWYVNLGADLKDKIDRWVEIYSDECKDVTGSSGRKVDDANKRAMKKITKWESNQ